jgi:glycopeptide antibiotics resistance protein
MPVPRRFAAVLLALYLAVALFLTLTALPLVVPEPNLIPFATIAWLLSTKSLAYAATQIVGNLLVLAPIGLLGPTAIPWLNRWWRIALATALLAGAIEITQWLLLSGRHADIDDVILNVFGALLAYTLRGLVWGDRASLHPSS